MSPFVSIFAAGALGLMGAMRSASSNLKRSHNPQQDELPLGNQPSPRSLASSISQSAVLRPA